MKLTLPQKHKPLYQIDLLSFFTGAGFLDIGFTQAGFNIIWHNEYSQPFIKGFEFGMEKLYGKGPSSKIQNTSSIKDITSEQIVSEAFGNRKLPNILGIIGGPPCPDFSAAGNNLGRNGQHGQLSEIYVDKILEIKPSFFLFENVPGLLRTKQHRAYLAELMERLTLIYKLDIETLNALDFGVPQDRERVFIIGIKREWLYGYKYPVDSPKTGVWQAILDYKYKHTLVDLYVNPPQHDHLASLEKKWFPWPIDSVHINAKNQYSWPDIVTNPGNVVKPIDIPEQLMVVNYICDDELSSLANSENHFIPHSQKFQWIKEGDVHRKSFKKLHRYRYSPSVAYGNNEVHLHPIEKRRLSVREALRLQMVPDDYALPNTMTLSNMFKTVSNGVPVKLSYEISLAMMRFIEGVINGNF